ncbi:MAG: 16S rRNA (guanine(966)-N(2))-methyltransferase RsmD [Gammaproteobacteria bacterium]|nr:16S rRNA (guanine(966)-N(2))-methyltransferase RsmD [Gammaproteobacteria bacterium]MDP2346511.1 16S rRNA (guanine(966)-N(2))-methyltransferase RsmD [Gammaproteobacteria bacterium]
MKKSSGKPGNTLRIIAGKWRSRKLDFPDVEGLRPTADRVRETLFNWLQEAIAREDCLDLFAGSGACGIEALSRGARHVTFVDSSAAAIKAIRANLDMLQAEGHELVCEDSLRWLQSCAQSRDKCPHSYGLVFIDPPFATGLLARSALALEQSGQLREDALIYLEWGSDIPAVGLPANWQMLKSKRAGAVYFCLYQRQGANVSTP